VNSDTFIPQATENILLPCKNSVASNTAGRLNGHRGNRLRSSKRRADMFKLYRSAAHTNFWIAYSSSTGWIMFPARGDGWRDRRPARGLDPLHLREVPARLAFNTGMMEHSDDLVAA
jgi:hypothetical protein